MHNLLIIVAFKITMIYAEKGIISWPQKIEIKYDTLPSMSLIQFPTGKVVSKYSLLTFISGTLQFSVNLRIDAMPRRR